MVFIPNGGNYQSNPDEMLICHGLQAGGFWDLWDDKIPAVERKKIYAIQRIIGGEPPESDDRDISYRNYMRIEHRHRLALEKANKPEKAILTAWFRQRGGSEPLFGAFVQWPFRFVFGRIHPSYPDEVVVMPEVFGYYNKVTKEWDFIDQCLSSSVPLGPRDFAWATLAYCELVSSSGNSRSVPHMGTDRDWRSTVYRCSNLLEVFEAPTGYIEELRAKYLDAS